MAEEFKLVCLAESPSKKQRRAVGTYVRCELELNGKAMWEQAADKYRFIYYSLVNGGRWVIGSGAYSRGGLIYKTRQGEPTKTTKGKGAGFIQSAGDESPRNPPHRLMLWLAAL